MLAVTPPITECEGEKIIEADTLTEANKENTVVDKYVEDKWISLDLEL